MFHSVTTNGRNQSACPSCVDAAEKTMRDYQDKVDDAPGRWKEGTNTIDKNANSGGNQIKEKPYEEENEVS